MGKNTKAVLAAIGLNIAYYRKQKGYTQQQLADLSAYCKNHIQMIETARAIPSLPALLDIAAALEVPVSKLVEPR